MVMEQQRREIERASANVKRTELDIWFRKQFHRAKAQDRWSDERWRRYREWQLKQREGFDTVRGEAQTVIRKRSA